MAEFELQPPDGSLMVIEHAPIRGEGDPYERWRDEIDTYYQAMKTFPSVDTTEIFQMLSAFTARASEIRNQIVRRESRRANAFRTREIEPFIDECERQFKFHSRIASVRELEWKVETNRYGGA